MRPVRLTYGDVGDAEKVVKDWTLMLCPIVIDQMRPVIAGTLLETTGCWGCYVQSLWVAASNHNLTVEFG